MISTVAFAVVAIAVNQAPAFADKTKYKVLGGVNLNYYCKKTFGAEFKSVLVGPTAGDEVGAESTKRMQSVFEAHGLDEKDRPLGPDRTSIRKGSGFSAARGGEIGDESKRVCDGHRIAGALGEADGNLIGEDPTAQFLEREVDESGALRA